MKLVKKSMIVATLAVSVLLAAVGAFLLLMGGEPEEEQREAAVKYAERWIRNNSPTFVFDGTGLELQQVERSAHKGEGPIAYEMVFGFESRHAGYGERAGEMLAQVITPHEMEIRVEKDPDSGRWQIVRAVTDGVFDERAGELLKDFKARETRRVDLYFMQVADGQEAPVAVSRDVPVAEGVEVNALEALLEGPRPDEVDKEYYSSIPEGVEIEQFELRSGTAYVSFNAALEKGVAGSARVQSIREQIRLTLQQFEQIELVEIAVEGRTEGILQP